MHEKPALVRTIRERGSSRCPCESSAGRAGEPSLGADRANHDRIAAAAEMPLIVTLRAVVLATRLPLRVTL